MQRFSECMVIHMCQCPVGGFGTMIGSGVSLGVWIVIRLFSVTIGRNWRMWINFFVWKIVIDEPLADSNVDYRECLDIKIARLAPPIS